MSKTISNDSFNGEILVIIILYIYNFFFKLVRGHIFPDSQRFKVGCLRVSTLYKIFNKDYDHSTGRRNMEWSPNCHSENKKSRQAFYFFCKAVFWPPSPWVDKYSMHPYNTNCWCFTFSARSCTKNYWQSFLSNSTRKWRIQWRHVILAGI